jgi:hypothetical protein
VTRPLGLAPGGNMKARYGVAGVPPGLIVGREGAVAFGVGPHEWGSTLLGALMTQPV